MGARDSPSPSTENTEFAVSPSPATDENIANDSHLYSPDKSEPPFSKNDDEPAHSEESPHILENDDEPAHGEESPHILEDDDEPAHGEDSPHKDEGAVPEEAETSSVRLIRFPVSRLKTIVKTVPSVHLINSESLAVLSHAAERFIADLTLEAARMATESGKKTVSRNSLDAVVATLPQYEFLDGMLD
ncbi:unnamed protein product [Dibothriocephalus latus]|uniref:Transcription factor CBF/NF-Y/archaeal histone domain-containing protein n=1 Tax=Dibothriocephalus latus TaxID=60516 RepID=A0A3P7L4J6_DIBLA|nr:unnamed protein product [Dibothriocephalus latus]